MDDLERDLRQRHLWPDPMHPKVRALLEEHVADPHPGLRPRTPGCETCADPAGIPPCPASQRPCGHHCNHAWSVGRCCWCGKSFEHG